MADQNHDIGILLKEARIRQGLTIEMVHEVTKIPIDALKAIEEGYKVRTLSSFYYKSFVRQYAQLVGIDAQEILSKISSSPKAHIPISDLPPLGDENKQAQEERLLNIANSFSLRQRKKIIKAILVLVGVILVGMAIFWTVKKVMAWVSSRPLAVKEEQTLTPTPKTQTAPAKSPAVKEVKAPSKTPLTIEKKVVLTVRARINAWFIVRVDGKVVFSQVLKKGNFETWKADEKIEVSGDVESLELEINGEPKKLSRRATQIRKVLITPEGLSVEK